MFYYMSIALPVAIFFIAIPGVGALVIRRRWRRFRTMIRDSAEYPRVGYEHTRIGPAPAGSDSGRFRFFGALEAVQGSDRIRLRGNNVSVAVSLRKVRVYLLPSSSDETVRLSDQTPSPVHWSRMSALPEGVKVFVAGLLFRDGAVPCFRDDPDTPLLVVIYDGPDTELVRRTIWCGRQKNEYWNRLTPVSLLLGSFSLGFVTFLGVASGAYRIAVVPALTAALAPVLPLLPPGVGLFYLYRRIWTSARYCRAERDLFRLVAEYAAGRKGDGERYRMTRIPGYRIGEYPEAVQIGFQRVPNTDLPDEVFLCGAATEEGAVTKVQRPLDPMAPFVVLPHEPAVLARRCAVSARFFEIASVVCFTAGLGVNMILCSMMLQYLLS
jgi:hypothetical protein